MASHGFQCARLDAVLPAETYDDDGSLDMFYNACRGALPISLSSTLDLSENHTFHINFSSGIGNGLNEIGVLSVSPWDATLEDDVKNINGSNRDYLLTAWYRYQYSFTNQANAAITLGLIDSSDFIDANEYANDELTQFMSASFVNSIVHAPPAYDPGVAFNLQVANWAFNFVGMSVGGADEDPNYKFWGTELCYQLNHNVGKGHYRVLLSGTSKDFIDADETALQRLLAFGVSFDQAVLDLGLFARLSWQKQDASIDYKSQYTFGLTYPGKYLARPKDTMGFAYGYLKGGNQNLRSNQIVEGYYSIHINDYVSLTLDVQHHHDKRFQVDDLPSVVNAWIYSTRLTATI